MSSQTNCLKTLSHLKLNYENTNLLDKIGLAIVILGLILLLADSLTKKTILKVTKNNELIHWIGLGIWVIGYLKCKQKKKKT